MPNHSLCLGLTFVWGRESFLWDLNKPKQAQVGMLECSYVVFRVFCSFGK